MYVGYILLPLCSLGYTKSTSNSTIEHMLMMIMMRCGGSGPLEKLLVSCYVTGKGTTGKEMESTAEFEQD